MGIYIHLFHGRPDVDTNLDDWGSDGPVLGPFKCVHNTYKSTIRLIPIGKHEDECHLDYVQDLIYYGGTYYGDYTVLDEYELDAHLRDRLTVYRADLAKRPQRQPLDLATAAANVLAMLESEGRDTGLGGPLSDLRDAIAASK